MSEFTDLLKEIETISEQTHLPFERRLMDTAVWFHKSKERIPHDDVFKRLEFTEKTLDITLELFAMCLQRMQQVEGRPKSANLWLPSGMQARGDMTRYG